MSLGSHKLNMSMQFMINGRGIGMVYRHTFKGQKSAMNLCARTLFSIKFSHEWHGSFVLTLVSPHPIHGQSSWKLDSIVSFPSQLRSVRAVTWALQHTCILIKKRIGKKARTCENFSHWLNKFNHFWSINRFLKRHDSKECCVHFIVRSCFDRCS